MEPKGQEGSESARTMQPSELQGLHDLHYYTIAEGVVVETVDLMPAADSFDAGRLQPSSDENEGKQRPAGKKRSAAKQWNSEPTVELEEEEKWLLLRALKQHGSRALDKLAAALPGRTPQQVSETVSYYRSLAAESMRLTAQGMASGRRNTRARAPRHEAAPLASWRAALTDALGTAELHTATADALRVLARCEYSPPPGDTCNVNFRQLYELLADAMDGRPTAQVSAESAAVLRRALTEVSVACKHLSAHGFAHHLERLELLNGGGAVAPSSAPPECPARLRLDKLLPQRAYNPLRVPAELCEFATPAEGD